MTIRICIIKFYHGVITIILFFVIVTKYFLITYFMLLLTKMWILNNGMARDVIKNINAFFPSLAAVSHLVLL